MKKIEYMKHITRKIVQSNPNKIFLFGDNLLERGYGGQAKEMRGEPNAIGIPTKKKPSLTPGSFFTDDEFVENTEAIDKSFDKIPKDCTIVIPEAGLGTGLAELSKRSPNTYEYLQIRINGLVG